MKRFHQLFLLTQVLLVTSIVVTSLAPVQAEVTGEEGSEECCGHEKEITKELKVHLDFYYELLAEKFAPTEIEKWKEIRSERDLLQKKLKEAKQRGELQNGDTTDKEWLDRHSELQDSFTVAVEKRDEEKIGKLIPQIVEHYGMLNSVYKQRLQLDN